MAVNYKEIAINNIATELNHPIIELIYKKPFSSVQGTFKTDIFNAFRVWTISDFKKYNEILLMSDNAFNIADNIHTYIIALIKELNRLKADLIGNLYINDRKKIDDYINRLIKFNDLLVDNFGIAQIEIESPPKYKKCNVYAMIIDKSGNRHIEIKSGYQFIYKGYTFQVYKVDNSKLKYIILPSCGISLTSYTTSIKSAHEYLTEHVIDLLNRENNAEKIAECEKMFIESMNESGFDLPKICAPIRLNSDNEVIEKSIEKSSIDENKINDDSIRIDRFIRRFNRIYNELYNDDINNTSNYSGYTALFDSNIDNLKDIIALFNRERADIISSDRELAAFMMTLEHYMNLGYTSINDGQIAIEFKVLNKALNDTIESTKSELNTVLMYRSITSGNAIKSSNKAYLFSLNKPIELLNYNHPITLTTGPG